MKYVSFYRQLHGQGIRLWCECKLCGRELQMPWWFSGKRGDLPRWEYPNMGIMVDVIIVLLWSWKSSLFNLYSQRYVILTWSCVIPVPYVTWMRANASQVTLEMVFRNVPFPGKFMKKKWRNRGARWSDWILLKLTSLRYDWLQFGKIIQERWTFHQKLWKVTCTLVPVYINFNFDFQLIQHRVNSRTETFWNAIFLIWYDLRTSIFLGCARISKAPFSAK